MTFRTLTIRVKSFRAERRGTVTILTALLLPVLIGFVALGAEYGFGLERQTENQRIADAAAYAAANYYTANASASNAVSMATSIAQNVGSLNGVPVADTTVNYTTLPSNPSLNVFKVKVAMQNPLNLAKVISPGATVAPAGVSYAEMGAQASACITSLATTGGIALSGGTNITAPLCGVATNNTLTVPCGDTVTAKSVSYGGAAPSQPCSGITTTPTANAVRQATVTDPLASNAGVLAAETHLATVETMRGPSGPNIAVTAVGAAVTFSLSSYPTTQQTSGGCTATYGNNTWTIACAPGSYNFTNFSIASGLNLNFNPTGSASNVYIFWHLSLSGTNVFGPGNYGFIQTVNVTSGTTTFGAGTYDFAQQVTLEGGATTSFGAGTFNFGQGLTAQGGTNTTFAGGTFNFGSSGQICGNGEMFAICHTGTNMTFANNGVFSIGAGIYVGGGSTLVLGNGATNSYNIAAGSQGDAIYLGGSANLTFGAATLFQVAGNINNSAGGGSCLTIGAATEHDINGSINTAGGTILGAGIYTISGYLALGENGGGAVWCGNADVGLQGANVTIAYGAQQTTSGSPCQNSGLCFAAGFNYVNLTAPTSGAMANLLIIGPQSNSSAGVAIAQGAAGVMSGAVYTPEAALTMSGGVSVSPGTGGCLQLVNQSITLSGSAHIAASPCPGLSSSGGGSSSQPTIVQ